MSDHPAPELLAAFVAGDADEDVGAHVRGCTRCSADVSAIERAVAELKGLPDPEPRPQDVAAWRSAVHRAGVRRQAAAWRWVTAASGVAALIIGFVAFSGGLAEQSGSGFEALDLAEESSTTETAWTADSVRGLIASGTVAGSQAMTADDRASAPQEMYTGTQKAARGSTAQDCDREIRKDPDEPEPQVLEGTWSGTPAWVLVYRVPERSVAEAWVVSKAGCTTLYFAQAPL